MRIDKNPDEAGRNPLIGNPIRALFCKISVNDVNNLNNHLKSSMKLNGYEIYRKKFKNQKEPQHIRKNALQKLTNRIRKLSL